MYICRSEDQPNITQMELSDYFLKQRKIIFNMEDPADVRKAQRVLKPKGMTKRRRKNTQAKPLKTKQQVINFKPQGVSLTVLNPEPERPSSPEYPFIDTVSQPDKFSTSVMITDSTLPDKTEQPEMREGVLELDGFGEYIVQTEEKTKPIHNKQPSEVDEDDYIAITVNAAFEEPTEEDNEVINQEQVKIKSAVKTPTVSKSSSKGEKKTPRKEIISQLTELSPVEPRPQNHRVEKNKKKKDEFNTSVGVASKTKLEKDLSILKELSAVQPTETKKMVPLERIAQFGTGGTIEVDCPFCGDSVSFYPIDIDGRKLANTRLCSCDAIVRLSIREFHYKIFQDLEIPMEMIKKRVKRRENPVFDENGSPIYSYALENQP